MNIGIDIDNVISNFNEVLLSEYLIHDKELREKGIINKNAEYIRKGMFDWSEIEEENLAVVADNEKSSNNVILIIAGVAVVVAIGAVVIVKAKKK